MSDSQNTHTPLPDDFFVMESGLVFSYRFADKEGKQIPNEFGYRVIKYLKPRCVHNGHAIIPHDEVKSILIDYGRDELAGILVSNGDAWIPPSSLKKKAKKVEEQTEEVV